MPRIAPEAEEKIRRVIRDALVLDPFISGRKMQALLFDKGFKSNGDKAPDLVYVLKLIKKVRGESIARADRIKLNDRLAEMREKQRLVYERLIKIAFYTPEMAQMGMKPPTYKEQIVALATIMRLDMGLFQAELDAGVFERKIGAIDFNINNNPELAEYQRKVVLAFQNFGFIGGEIIEQNAATTPKLTTGDHRADSVQPGA